MLELCCGFMSGGVLTGWLYVVFCLYGFGIVVTLVGLR